MFIFHIGAKKRDFSPFVDSLGEEFVQGLVTTYQSFVASDAENENSERSYWHHVRRFLLFLCSDPSSATLRGHLQGAKVLKGSEVTFHWQIALSNYRELLPSEVGSLVTANNYLHTVRKFVCQHCADEVLVPRNLEVAGWNITPSLGRQTTMITPSVLEVLRMEPSDVESLCVKLADDDSDVALDGDLQELLLEMFHEAESFDSTVNKVELSIGLLQARMTTLRKAAASEYVSYIRDTQEADEWVKDEALQTKALRLWEIFTKEASGRGKYHDLLVDQPLEVLVVMLKLYNRGRVPLYKESWYDRYSQRRNHYGIKTEQLERYLGLDNFAMGCAYALILIDSLGNSQSIWDLSTDCLSHIAGNDYRITWIKPRAGLANQVKHWEFKARAEGIALTADSLTLKDVIEHQLVCRSVFEGYIAREHEDKLFIHNKKNFRNTEDGNTVYEPSQPALNTVSDWFQDLCDIASGGKWVATPKTIRGTELLLIGMLTKSPMQVMSRGQHLTYIMPERYTFHFPELFRRDEEIRKFLAWWERVITVNIKDFALKVGINEKAYAAGLDDARAIREVETALAQQVGGLGCSNPYDGIQPGTKKGEVCTAIKNCPSCPNRRGIFVLSLQTMTHLLHWHSVLEQANAENRKGWNVWWAFTTKVLVQYGNDPHHETLMRLAEEQAATTPNPYIGLIPDEADETVLKDGEAAA